MLLLVCFTVETDEEEKEDVFFGTSIANNMPIKLIYSIMDDEKRKYRHTVRMVSKAVLIQCWQLKSDPRAVHPHSGGLCFVVLLSRVGSLRCERTAQGSDSSCLHCTTAILKPLFRFAFFYIERSTVQLHGA